MAKTKLILRVPTLGAQRGDEIEVDATEVDALVANGTARRKVAAPKSEKD